MKSVLQRQRGILPGVRNMVFRNTYSGRGILADNVEFTDDRVDDRGYLPVERWILSLCEAQNPTARAGEGLSSIVVDGLEHRRLAGLPPSEEALVFGGSKAKWPLIKLLDIGGRRVRPDFSETMEMPPIPVHVHGGEIRNGRVRGPGKLETYFFPPERANQKYYDGAVTRLGIRPDVTRADVLSALGMFGRSDGMYALLNVFPVEAFQTWIIRPGVIHAPGPVLTLEVQTPQDDFNLLSWHMGERLFGTDLQEATDSLLLRGLASEREVCDQVIDWESSAEPEFAGKYRHTPVELVRGPWGTAWRILFSEFYGEYWEVLPGEKRHTGGDDEPIALFVWDGSGCANGKRIAGGKDDEFLLAPGYPLEVECDSAGTPLKIVLIWPISGRRGTGM